MKKLFNLLGVTLLMVGASNAQDLVKFDKGLLNEYDHDGKSYLWQGEEKGVQKAMGITVIEDAKRTYGKVIFIEADYPNFSMIDDEFYFESKLPFDQITELSLIKKVGWDDYKLTDRKLQLTKLNDVLKIGTKEFEESGIGDYIPILWGHAFDISGLVRGKVWGEYYKNKSYTKVSKNSKCFKYEQDRLLINVQYVTTDNGIYGSIHELELDDPSPFDVFFFKEDGRDVIAWECSGESSAQISRFVLPEIKDGVLLYGKKTLELVPCE